MKYLYILLLLTLPGLVHAQDPAYPPAPVNAQVITAAEYFVDTDPGAGNGTAIAVSPGVNLTNASASVNVTGLSNGVHRLYLRTRNAEGRWSITSVRDFLYDADIVYSTPPPAPQNIIAAEYFIDTDPGAGSGTPITVTPGVTLNNVPVTVNTSGLPSGAHRLYVRTKNNEGRWSITTIREFIVDFDFNYPASPAAAQNLTAAEYFIDTDPGFGNGTALSISPNTDLSNQSANINTTALSTGTHRLYVRFRNNEGAWSLVSMKDFIVESEIAYPPAMPAAQNVVAMEYFIDTDPGIGNGVPISVTPAIEIDGNTASINTTGLSLGSHRLYIRSRNNEGSWSVTAVKDFIVDSEIAYPTAPDAPQNIIAAEYFIDTDPGHGNGTVIPVTPGIQLANLNVTVNTTGLTTGTHRLYLRTRNQEGRWSITQHASFGTSLITLSEDSLLFGSTPLSVANVKQLVVKNAGNITQTITGLTAAAPFTSDFTGTVSLAAGESDTILVSFTPTAAQLYEQTAEVQTSAGNYTVFLGGTGISQALSWSIDPATGHNYGTLATGTPGIFNFTIRNTGNVPVVLSSATSSDPAFVPAFIAGTSIAANGTLSLPVTFTPSAIGNYTAQLAINSSTNGLNAVTTALTGTGYTPGTPPVLSFPSQAPYQSVRGVNAEAGQPGTYTYKINYRSANNRAPEMNFPKLGIDRNADGDFNDAGEGLYTMSKEGTSTDYAAGVTYTYTISHPDYSSTLGYRFVASDDLGNAAVAVDVAYKSGPVITYQLLDLKIFANDISFSKNDPLPGEIFTVSATITNSSAFTATNVPVKFYKDTLLLDSALIPVVNPFSTATINKAMSFAVDGFYPVKVWIDSSRTLSESNVLNNYAIRPIIVGNVALPGGIIANTSPSVQTCPAQVVISGIAQYYGMATPIAVAGAEVTINTGTQTFTTTTNSDGTYSYLWNNPPCGGTIGYTVSVTDFTFTSKTVAGSVTVSCPTAGACTPVQQPGIVMASLFTSEPCAQTVGNTGSLNVVVTYRARNLDNFWNGWDQILKDTVKIFHNGNLIQTYTSADGTTSPGAIKTFPVNITLNTSGPNVIEAKQTYIYNEFFEIPGAFYHGIMIPMTGSGSTVLIAEEKRADLTIQGFQQTSFRRFEYQDANIACDDAGPHTVRVYDSIPGSGVWVLLKEDAVASLSARSVRNFSFTGTSLAFGEHIIRIITDEDNAVTEKSESNNVFQASIFIPRPDLTVDLVRPVSTGGNIGSSVSFTATIKNSGTAPGPFAVSFKANGVQIGNKIAVNNVGEKGETVITSDPYLITTADNACPVDIEVMADADAQVNESLELNNIMNLGFGSDLVPVMLPGEVGSAFNPVIVRVSTTQDFHPLIRNLGTRDIRNVSVRFMLDGNKIGDDAIAQIKAGEFFGAPSSFTRAFTVPGNYVVQVFADTLNTICESNEANNQGTYHIKVVDSNPDLEVLSQYISPGSLNPQPGQSISLVGTVRNAGLKPTPGSVLRFMVDEIQVGSDVAVDALQPGQDTTVAATATYSSLIPGIKIMKIVVDPAMQVTEEREDNNEATRTMIVGDAPDLARSQVGSIRFESGFAAGDSVMIHYSIKNNGSMAGNAWVRFLVMNDGDAITAIDSVQFSLAAGGNMIVSRKLKIDIDKGTVIAQIVSCQPVEYDLLNNNDTLAFSNVMMLTGATTVNADLDMKKGITGQIPGWIGGKLVLGDYDLVINGTIINFDTAHFVVTNGTGRLRLANNETVNVFPVGPSVYNSNFAKLTNNGTADHFSMRVVPWILKNGITGDTVRTGNVNRTWFVDEEVAGGSNALLELFWNEPDEQPGFAPMSSRLGHYTASAWQLGDAGIPLQDSINRYSRFHSGYNEFSPFIVTSGVGIALPVKLLSFDATLHNDKTLLRWKTSDEINSSHFEIEHSMNGQQFDKVGIVSTNNIPGIYSYQYLHADPAEGTNYYRLKMVDTDGTFSYSPVRSVLLRTLQVLQAFPNPAQRMVTVKGLAANGTVQLISVDGKLVRQMLTTGNTMTLDLVNLPAGVYVLTYRNEGVYQQIKLRKD